MAGYLGRLGIAAIVFAVGTQAAVASEIYCRVNKSTLVNDGDTATVDWTVVASAVRKSAIPGRAPTTGCDFNWRSLGDFYKPVDFVEKPKLGQAENSPRYRIFYQSAKPGDDEFTVRMYWLNGRNGNPESATVKYVVHVVNEPL